MKMNRLYFHMFLAYVVLGCFHNLHVCKGFVKVNTKSSTNNALLLEVYCHPCMSDELKWED